jgi:hypothetical protein
MAIKTNVIANPYQFEQLELLITGRMTNLETKEQ